MRTAWRGHGAALQAIGLSWAVAIALAAPFALGPAPATAQYGDVSAGEASVKELRRAIRYREDGGHHPALVALRQLRDPSLRPLFQSLVQSEHWSIQIDGILGLAELEERRSVDPFLIAQLKGDSDRSTAIAAAVGLGLLGAKEAEAMLAWTDLPPRDRVLVAAELVRLGGSPAAAPLAALADETDAGIAVLADVIVAEVSGESPEAAAALEQARVRLAALPERSRQAAFAELAVAVGRFRLASAVPLLVGELKDAKLPNDARLAALSAILAIDPEAGYAAWRAAVESGATPAMRVRLGLLLLGSEIATLPANAAAPLRTSTPDGKPAEGLVLLLADAIDGLAGSADPLKTLPALVAARHRPSLGTLLDRSRRLPERERLAVLRAMADLLQSGDRDQLSAAAAELAVRAIGELAALAPDEVAERLGKAAGDANLETLLVVGLVNAGTAEAAARAYAHHERLSRSTGSLALIAHARFAERLSPEELAQLGIVAAGGGQLEPDDLVQAAWLYARHSGNASQTIAAVLAPDADARSSPSGATAVEAGPSRAKDGPTQP
jgi:hypothetical protein